MKSRLVRFGIARSIYVGVVSVALVVTAVHTFTPGDNPDSSAAADATIGAVETTATNADTSVPGPAPATTTTIQKSTSSNGNATSPVRATTTIPHTGTTVTVAGPQVTTTVAELPHPSTTVRSTTTVVPTTSTTIYRPGSIVMVIPAGTQAKINRGEDVSDVLPLTVDIKVGQYIYLVNKDNYFYSYGPLSVMPLDTTPYFFSTAGNQTGYCSISQSTITFRVTN